MPQPFDLQPTLRGSLVELSPLRPEHFDSLFAVASDPLIWAQHPEHDRYRPEVFRKFFDGGLACGGAFIVRDVRNGQVIGSSRYFGYDAANRCVEIGWTFLACSQWGGRYNGEMKRLMMEHAFQFVDRVLFFVGPDNQRSRRAVEKIGGVITETRVKPDGTQFVVFEVTAEAYRAGRAVSR